MGVADVDAFERFDLGEVEAEGFEGALELAGGAVGDLVPGLGAAYVQAARSACCLPQQWTSTSIFFASSRLR